MNNNPFPAAFPWPFGTVPANGGAAPSETSTGVNPDFATIDHSREYNPPLNVPTSNNPPQEN